MIYAVVLSTLLVALYSLGASAIGETNVPESDRPTGHYFKSELLQMEDDWCATTLGQSEDPNFCEIIAEEPGSIKPAGRIKTQMYQWWCAQPGNGDKYICEHYQEQRDRQTPMRHLYTDWCSVREHMHSHLKLCNDVYSG